MTSWFGIIAFVFGTIAPAVNVPSLANPRPAADNQTTDNQASQGPGDVIQIVICTPNGLRSIDVTLDPESGDWVPVEGEDPPAAGAAGLCPCCLGPQCASLCLLPIQTALSAPYPPFTFIVLSPAELPLGRRGLGIGDTIIPRAPPLTS